MSGIVSDAAAFVARRWRIVVIAAGVLIAMGGAWTVWGRVTDLRQTSTVVHRGDLVLSVDVTGTLRAKESEILGPPGIPNIWNFRISMLAPEGKEVRKGDPVLAFDITELQRQLDDKRNERDSARKELERLDADLALASERDRLQLAEAEARLRRAELKLEAPDELRGESERRQIEIDDALAKQEVRHLTGRIEARRRASSERISNERGRERDASRRVTELEAQLAAMTVRAGRSGTVVYRPDWDGEKKKVGDNVWRALKVVEIPDLTRMEAEGEIDESDAGRIRAGQSVALRLDAHADLEYRGKIATLGRTVQPKPQLPRQKVLPIVIELDATDAQRMRPGMRFKGQVELSRIKGVTLLPHDAIFETAEGPVVYRRGLTGWQRVAITVGQQNKEEIEVVSGISAGDRVRLRKVEEDAEEEKTVSAL
jgi:multidrug resistance efflux pump